MRGRTSTAQGFRREKWFEIHRVMNTHRVAVLAVQESHLTDELAANIRTSLETKLALSYSPLPETRNAAGVALVFNKSLLKTDLITSREVVPGRAILASIPWHGDRTIKILNVYAPNEARSNESFWAHLNETIQADPTLKPDLLLGDFNIVEDALDRLPCHPDDPNAVAALGELKCELGLTDGWRDTYPDHREYSHQHAPNASQGRIDRIYIANDLLRPSSEWKIDSPQMETDHWLVSVNISTPDAPEIGKGRWQIPTYLFEDVDIMAEIDTLSKKAENQIKANRFRRSDTVNPQTTFAKLKLDITKICRDHAKKVHPTIMNKIKKLKDQLVEVNNNAAASEEDRMLDTIVIKTEMLELERILFESNRAYASTRHHVHAETICRDWVRSNRARKPRDTVFCLRNPLDPASTPTHDSREMAKIAGEYHTRLQENDRDPSAHPDEEKMDRIMRNVTTKTTPKQKNELAKYLKRDGVHTALGDAANDKAAGLDGIPMELWKKMSAKYDAAEDDGENPYCDIVGMMTLTFNDIEKHGIAPSTKFNEGWMCPIYKKGERDNIANYRPITVLNTDYKIMTKALANKLAEVAPTLIHPDQAGFIRGRSIYDQVKLAKLTIDYGRITETNGAIVALDQEKAYDKVLHPYLWGTLERFDIPQHFITTVKNLYCNASTSVLINGILSEPFQVIRGVRQGDALSCLLFDLGIEPLAATIRTSPIQGIKIPNAPENIKCKLFADDTMVYLNEQDDLATLETHALNPWCEVSGATFNIAKTEVIPIGTKEYRTTLLQTRRLNPTGDRIQENVRIAAEGQPVRVLGAWIGNGVDQATPWTPTIEKIAAHLKRWEANHPTTEGRRLITQMIIGGMTQYLAKVQGIPEAALKTLDRLIRNFAWNGDGKPTIAMSHMSLRAEEGGKKVLDIYARNEAIQLTWIQSYLKLGKDRPTWALVADVLLGNDVPGEPESLKETPNARINQFLQTWKSRKNKRKCANPDGEDTVNIPGDLREMVKTANKHGVRLESIHPEEKLKLELPAIRSSQTSEQNKPDTLSDKHGKCIRNVHKVQSLKDVADLSENLPRQHKRNKRCRCDRCTKIRTDTNNRCKHPNKCIERATRLLKTINDKWNPMKMVPPDLLTNPTPEETGKREDPATEETIYTLNPFRTETTMAGCFRVFTDPKHPPEQQISRAPKTDDFDNPPIIAYTDGSCIDNGETTAKAGSGIWFGDNDMMNMSLRVPGPNQSNQVGELYAILRTLEMVPHDRALTIRTDSMYAIKGLTSCLEEWEDQGWMYTKHAALFKAMTAWVRYRSNRTEMIWVKGHSGIRGNEGADRLAGEGAAKDPPDHEMTLNTPNNTIPSGAKLAALSQKDFYRIIKQRNRPPPRRGTELNIARVQACAQEYYGTAPTRSAVWKSTKHKDLTKKTREFIWKCLHNAFKIGGFWNNIKDYESRGECALCGTEESMEHIMTECTAPGREKVWSLANELWAKRSPDPIPTNYGAILGCGLTNFKKTNGKPDKGMNRLFRIL